jgi:hypothetical protein
MDTRPWFVSSSQDQVAQPAKPADFPSTSGARPRHPRAGSGGIEKTAGNRRLVNGVAGSVLLLYLCVGLFFVWLIRARADRAVDGTIGSESALLAAVEEAAAEPASTGSDAATGQVIEVGGGKAAPVAVHGDDDWRKIAWQPSAAAAVQASKAQNKPLFLFSYVSPGGKAGLTAHPQADKDDC